MRKGLFLVVLFLAAATTARAQEEHQHHNHEQMMNFVSQEFLPGATASGTSLEPLSTPQSMIHKTWGRWTWMFHGQAFLAYSLDRNNLFGTNWFMASATRRAGGGNFTLRTMLTLEPVTIRNRQYPLFFQTGETAFGRPIVNGQHPHDALMEIAMRYSHPLGKKTTAVCYAALVGDPALGPVATPHSWPASEMSEMRITHHWVDSTHISEGGVFTCGIFQKWFGVEASGFHGREPDENRWNIDFGKIDSWSARLTFSPGRNWLMQFSHGHLTHPELLEPGDVDRTTASIIYNRPLTNGNWASTFVWGRNHHRFTRENSDAFVLETNLQFKKQNYLYGRFESVDKKGLFLTDDPESEPARRVHALTLGFSRDIIARDAYRIALGLDMSFYKIPADLQELYTAHPKALRVSLRLRLGQEMSHDMHHH